MSSNIIYMVFVNQFKEKTDMRMKEKKKKG